MPRKGKKRAIATKRAAQKRKDEETHLAELLGDISWKRMELRIEISQLDQLGSELEEIPPGLLTKISDLKDHIADWSTKANDQCDPVVLDGLLEQSISFSMELVILRNEFNDLKSAQEKRRREESRKEVAARRLAKEEEQIRLRKEEQERRAKLDSEWEAYVDNIVRTDNPNIWIKMTNFDFYDVREWWIRAEVVPNDIELDWKRNERGFAGNWNPEKKHNDLGILIKVPLKDRRDIHELRSEPYRVYGDHAYISTDVIWIGCENAMPEVYIQHMVEREDLDLCVLERAYSTARRHCAKFKTFTGGKRTGKYKYCHMGSDCTNTARGHLANWYHPRPRPRSSGDDV